jgi:hypothetical protein
MKEKTLEDLKELIDRIKELPPEEREATEEETTLIRKQLQEKQEEEDRQRSAGKKILKIQALRDQTGFLQNAIFIDGEHFDWDIDEEAFEWARRQSPAFFEAVKADIVAHFLTCLSEVVGRKITMQDFMIAQKTGWI